MSVICVNEHYYHNQTVLNSLRKGDLIEFNRGLYSHWGVYVGDGDVVHLAGEDNDGINATSQSGHFFSIAGELYDKARVCKENFWNIVQGRPAYRNNEKDSKYSSLHADYIVKRALNSIGSVGYNLIYKNCEHFAKWCRYNIAESDQVDNVMAAGKVALGIGAAALFIGGIFAYANKESEEDKKKMKK